MTRIIGLLVLFLATLTLGGCAGMPLDYGNGAGGYGYGGSCPQPYGGGMPGYAVAAPPRFMSPNLFMRLSLMFMPRRRWLRRAQVPGAITGSGTRQLASARSGAMALVRPSDSGPNKATSAAPRGG